MVNISIRGVRFYADLIGRLKDGRIACLGFAGRKTGVDRALVHIYRGEEIVVGGRISETLGERAYRVYKSPLGVHRLSRAYVMPAGAIASFQKTATKSKSDQEQEKAKSIPPILLWRKGTEYEHSDRLWAYIRENTPVPMLDSWRDPVMRRLETYDVEQDDSIPANSNDIPEKAIAPIEFDPCGDGDWRGVAIRLTEDQVAQAVWEALVSKEAKIPKGACSAIN